MTHGLNFNAFIHIFNLCHDTSVIIPNSVTIIEEGTFAGNQLTGITIPNNVTTIDASAFKKNPLTHITIGANVNLLVERSGGQDFPPFDNNFHIFYNSNGRKAGELYLGWGCIVI